MRVRVLLFAALREAAGTAELELELPEEASVGDACEELLRFHPALRGMRYAFALDHHYATRSTPIGGAREIALIPPVSGG